MEHCRSPNRAFVKRQRPAASIAPPSVSETRVSTDFSGHSAGYVARRGELHANDGYGHSVR